MLAFFSLLASFGVSALLMMGGTSHLNTLHSKDTYSASDTHTRSRVEANVTAQDSLRLSAILNKRHLSLTSLFDGKSETKADTTADTNTDSQSTAFSEDKNNTDNQLSESTQTSANVSVNGGVNTSSNNDSAHSSANSNTSGSIFGSISL